MLGGLSGALPRWILVAGALGIACTLFVACAFVVGGRLFPTVRADHRERAGGEHRRHAEIREFLRAIEEPFAEDHPIDGNPVAFYLPQRDVVITFDARAYYRLGRTGTRAVLVEHEMPGVHLADRLPFETPEIEFDTEEDDATGTAFAVLGVSTGASTEEVRAAYREKVKDAHPDHGGDPESFRQIREAYTMARDHAG